jgi:hypothetical protein
MKLGKFIVTGAVAAAVAAPLGQAASNNRVQLAGNFVAPSQLSEAQLDAGHGPATRLVQIGGALVAPTHASTYQQDVGNTAADGTSTDSSSDLGTGGITAIAVLGAIWMMVAASMLVFRHRRKPATALS